jgi:hypothetical protein
MHTAWPLLRKIIGAVIINQREGDSHEAICINWELKNGEEVEWAGDESFRFY